ncbi:MAG: hypothetical protein Q4D53_04385 [Leptotrichiaceae bacterium]|nr:hypothetical protein [Leptotrichiaceae bacterium]
MFKYLAKEKFLNILLLPDITALPFIFIHMFYIVVYPELIYLLLIYVLIRALILASAFFLLYIINETVKIKFINKSLKLILKYGIFSLSMGVMASYPMFILFM